MKATLAMALHFHQPVGNFDDVINRACDKCYMPFLKLLKSYPDIRMTLHFTGCLLEWAEEKRPELVERLRDLAGSGQVEMMTGGFYEPILISIPERDRSCQINMLSEYVRKNFACEPEGAWVAERVWEPGLAKTFSRAGVKYIVLDDTHFIYAGLRREDIRGYFITEDNGEKVAVFPTDKALRYHIPYKMPDECVSYMRESCSKNGDSLFVYGDDGEKFGEWPGTYKWVFEEKWLENFFNALNANSEWLKTQKLSNCLDIYKSSGRVYLPTSSYEEMLEWSLPADSQIHMKNILNEVRSMGKEDIYKPFIRGGFWRNFFTKYPESNHMNKRMILASTKLDKARRDPGNKLSVGMFAEAEKELCKAQCNCAYWHGVFGGLYLYHLRNAVYEHIIRSEALIDIILKGNKEFCLAHTCDIDSDGSEDILLENRLMALIVSPYNGGTIKEIDSKVLCQNYVNSLSRKKEAYHGTILEKIKEQSKPNGQVKTIHDGIQTADASLKEHMSYDKYPRHCLIDHFLDPGTDMMSFPMCGYEEVSDINRKAFSAKIKEVDQGIEVIMSTEGNVGGGSMLFDKKITLPEKGCGFKVEYTLTNKSGDVIETVFGPEFNFTMRHANSPDYRLCLGKSKLYGLDQIARADKVKEVRIFNEKSKESLTISFKTICEVWHFPVNTVSQSEKAYELNYQCSSFIPLWRLRIEPKSKKKISMLVKLDY